jgi:hypothetical protein
MIITEEVQQILDGFAAKDEGGSQELVKSAMDVMQTVEDILGTDVNRWYGALFTHTWWMTWFRDMCMSWPGGVVEAYRFLPAADAIMLLDVFLTTHPMGKTAMVKFGLFGAEGEDPLERDPAKVAEIDQIQADVRHMARQRMTQAMAKNMAMATPPTGDGEWVEIEGDQAKAVIDALKVLGIDLPIQDGPPS